MRFEYQLMLGLWVAVSIWVGIIIYANRNAHPKVLFCLFMTELWERFSYYGMRALLVLYVTAQAVTGGFNQSEDNAYGIYGAYGALVYLTPLAGGFLADRFLGFRRSIIWGAILMALGQFVLSLSSGTELIAATRLEEAVKDTPMEAVVASVSGGVTPQTGSIVLLYIGLALLVTGNGFFKPNISSLIGKFYAPGDPRRDGAFTIFYMGINIGAFLAPFTCGVVGELEGWHWGFFLAGCGMVAGLLMFLYTSWAGYLEHHADPPNSNTGADPTDLNVQPADPGIAAVDAARERDTSSPIRPTSSTATSLLIILGTFLFLPIAAMLIHWNFIMDGILVVVGVGAISYMIYLSFNYEIIERQRIWVIIVLLLFTAVFWSFFELAGSALSIFTRDNVNRNLFGTEIATSAFQGVNAFFIMVFAPLFAVLWTRLGRKGIEPPAPLKFVFGLVLLGAGFLILNLGTAVANAAMVPMIFLILLYMLHTLGELTLSPVGLSLVTKLAPAKVVGFMMGFWFLSSAIAHQAGKWIARATTVSENASLQDKLDRSIEVFNYCGFFAVGSGILLLFMTPLLTRWMHGVR